MKRQKNVPQHRGDDGTTALVGGRRVSKDSTRVWACGSVDELNSVLGQAQAIHQDLHLRRSLRRIQNDLFDLGAELATLGGTPRIRARHIRWLETLMDKVREGLPPLKGFILPGGTEVAAALHVARSVCRRAERLCVSLDGEEPLGPWVIPYLNRLSNALFDLARQANHRARVEEICWRK